MEEAAELGNYLPLSFKTPKEQARPADFEKGLIGFDRDERALTTATSPFVFSAVNERTILRFFKLIACNNNKISTYAKLVDDRNRSAHPNGHIFFSTQTALDSKITEILRVADEIQIHVNYLSQKDIDICRVFNLTSLADQSAFDSIAALHEIAKSEYSPDEEGGG